MVRAKLFINGSQKQLIKSKVTKQGCRSIDQACFTIPLTINAEIDNTTHYIQDIVDLDNLKGMWTFDCHVADESGYQHHGAGLTNVPSSLVRYEFNCCCLLSTATCPLNLTVCMCGTEIYICPGKVGAKAFSFNGCTSLIVPCECKFDFRQDQKWSTSTWIFPTVMCTNMGLIVKRNAFACCAGYSIEVNACNQIQFDIGEMCAEFSVTSTCAITQCMWTHVVTTYDATSDRSGMRLYINGLLDSTGAAGAIAGPMVNNDSVTLGADSCGCCKLTGLMDDVYIFANKILTAAQVKALYNRGSLTYVDGKWGNAVCFDGVAGHVTITDNAPPDPRFGSLVAQFKFECCNVEDSKACNCGTVTGCSTFVASIIDCCAFSFNGSTRINLCNPANFSFAKCVPFTIGGWIKNSCAAAGNDIIFAKRLDLTACSTGYSLHFDNTCSRPVFQISNGTTIYSVSGVACSIPDCEWHHVIAVYNGLEGQTGMSLYIDGVLNASGSSGTITGTITNCLTASIGGGNAGACDYLGLADCIRIWSKQLAVGSITSLFNGTFSQLTGEYEFIGWVKATANCCDRKIFTKTTTICNGVELILECSVPSGPGFTCSGFTCSGFTTCGVSTMCALTFRHNNTILNSSADITDCCFHQFRVKKDANNLISLYIDNVLQSSATDASDATIETPLEIGTCSALTCFYDGALDSFRWYSGGGLTSNDSTRLFENINPISIDKFGGRITKLKKELVDKRLIAQSFGKVLAEVEVRPTLYNCRSPEFIVHDLVINNTCFTSIPFSGKSGIVIQQYFADGKLFDIIDDLLSLFGAVFYTNSQQLFFCVLRSFTIKPNVFNHGCNTSIFDTKFDDTELVNDLIVLGENIRFQKLEIFCGTGSKTLFDLAEPAVSLRVEHPLGTCLEPEIDYTYNPLLRTLTFDACSIPVCGVGNILVSYEFERPLFMRSKKQASIDEFGVHAKRLVLPWIGNRTDGIAFMNGYLNRYSDVRQNLVIDHPFLLSSLRENDVVRVISCIKEIDNTFVIKSIEWKYPDFETTLNVGEYSFNDFEFDKELNKKIHDLENAISTIKELRDFEQMEELLAMTDVVTVGAVDIQLTETLVMTDAVNVTEVFDAGYDDPCTTYDGDDAYV